MSISNKIAELMLEPVNVSVILGDYTIFRTENGTYKVTNGKKETTFVSPYKAAYYIVQIFNEKKPI